MKEHHVKAKQEEPEEEPQAHFTARVLEQAMLFSQIIILPLAVTAGYRISRNVQREQLIITWVHCIPNQFTQRILWVQKPKEMLLNIVSFFHVVVIPVPDTSILMQALHVSLVSILSTDRSKQYAVVSQPPVAQAWPGPRV